MKKFMKAIAFVTVMCMLLSTVAFAANSVPANADEDKTFIVNVTEAGANEQVALMVVDAAKEDYDFSDPLYLNQQAADANGDTTFEAVLTNATVDAVDVYVGYAANGTNPAIKVGTVTLKETITTVTVTKVDTNIVSANGKQQIGAGVAIELNVQTPEDVSATSMIWAIRYNDGTSAEDKVKYHKIADASSLGIGPAMDGSITLGLAFLNGFNRVGEEIASVEIKDVDVIFMFSDGEEVYTNKAGDEPNKLK